MLTLPIFGVNFDFSKLSMKHIQVIKQGGASVAFPGVQRRAPGDTDSCKGTGKGVPSRVDPPERQSSMNSESNLWKTVGLRKGSASAGNGEAMHFEACKGLRPALTCETLTLKSEFKVTLGGERRVGLKRLRNQKSGVSSSPLSRVLL
ncbi:hypothetical protein AVEN_179579-1 [Araneus ventricosus]|uniref:Uncharacterized protein n=1 Tax=Araneus ventricosus TaxID=182803 RepID=A0A4Y2BER6_ARAVE|nr:hypothetical protein AVEN_179579-1 [Araneus ventricosus]